MKIKFPISSLRESCLATLAYFDLCDFPLNLAEFRHFLLGGGVDKTQLEDFLNKQDEIQFEDGYYFLKARSDIVALRKSREKILKRLWWKARFFITFMQLVPFVRMVAVCNTLAFNNPTENSDIDLFIVAKKKRLFIVRYLSTILFALLGVRRHGTKIAGRFCLSFFVSEEALDLQKIQLSNQDIYLPFWILTLKPMYGKKTYNAFLEANTWLSNYFQKPNVASQASFLKENFSFKIIAKISEFILAGFIGNFLENKLKQHQLKKHQINLKDLGKDSSVIVNDQMLKFHNVDRRAQIAEAFQERMSSFH